MPAADTVRPLVPSEIRSILGRSNSGARQQSLAEARLPPGGKTERHRHAKTEEFYYILRGRGAMTLGAERRRVGPGDGILIPPGAAHTIRNVGRAPLVFLCCCAPPYSHADTIMMPPGAGSRSAVSSPVGRKARAARRSES